MAIETATIAGGCFWCLQPIFQELKGVQSVECGYAGGQVPDPSYEQVCAGTTGHAEAVQIIFDPATISYEELLRVFFEVHDPTTLNRQGADVGSQYRSAIFHHTTDQLKVAKSLIAELGQDGHWSRPIVTELAPFAAFYRAEDYHQDYFRKNPYGGYCIAVISPKVRKFRKEFRGKLKE
jgi:peptide-methionine (S)-S-oxide reductase